MRCSERINLYALGEVGQKMKEWDEKARIRKESNQLPGLSPYDGPLKIDSKEKRR